MTTDEGMDLARCIIRCARLEDIAAVQRLNLQHFRHDLEHGFNRHLDLDWPLSEEAHLRWQGLIEQEDGLLLVAVRAKEVVGYLAGHLGQVGAARPGRRPALLRGLFVAEEVRRRGTGERLVRRFLAWAAEKQAAEITVAVAPGNEPALALYRKVGFRDQTLILAL